MLKVRTEKLCDTTILHLYGNVVRGTEIATLRNAVFSADASTVVLDFSRVGVIDAGGLGELLKLRGWTQANGIILKLVNPTRRVRQVFEVTCLDTVFNISVHEDVLAAVA